MTDSCNHRIQVFDTDGKLLRYWGKQGSGPGQLYYPYGLALGPKDTVYVCEFGNSRVQQFTRDGRPLACWGSGGREPGQLLQSLGGGARQPRNHSRVGYEQPQGTIGEDGMRD